MRTSVALGILMALCITWRALAGESPPPAEIQPVPWVKHCTLQGIDVSAPGDLELLETLVASCDPVDACALSCIRSGCAQDIGGGCFHMCNPSNGALDLVRAADEYQARTAWACKRPPNNSLKPKPLRGSA
jgi:hypothetical protein